MVIIGTIMREKKAYLPKERIISFDQKAVTLSSPVVIRKKLPLGFCEDMK